MDKLIIATAVALGLVGVVMLGVGIPVPNMPGDVPGFNEPMLPTIFEGVRNVFITIKSELIEAYKP